MNLTVEINDPLIGPTHLLEATDVANWDDIIDDIATTEDLEPCTFTVVYNNITYTGEMRKSLDSVTLLVVFNTELIALPSNMCLEVVCPDSPVENPDCYDNFINPVLGDERIVVADENGCPIGYITVAGLLVHLAGALEIPTSLCDLLDVTEIPQGGLVASDRILTTNGGCNLKSVPQNDVTC